MLGLRRRIASVVGEVVALRLAVAHRDRGVGPMGAGCVAETELRVEEIVLLVYVKTLVLVRSVLLFDELVVDSVRVVVHVPVLEVGEDGEVIAEPLGGLHESAVVILSSVGVIVGVAAVVEVGVIQAGKGRILLYDLWIGHISQVAEMVAPEHLGGQTSDHVPAVVVVVDVIDKTGGVLLQTLLADKIRTLYGVALGVREGSKAELGEFVVRTELIVVAVAVGVVEGKCGLKALVDVPGGREDVVILPEIIRGLRPIAAIVKSVAGGLVGLRIH